MGYSSIADHGLIGDLQSAALVSTNGTIDWFCFPRFDSPSIFASLLDDERGGRFVLAPRVAATTTTQMYMPETAILVTRHVSESGIAEVVDFMPIDAPTVVSDRRRLVRAVRGVRGEVEFEALLQPRFDYGRQGHEVNVDNTSAVFDCGSQRVRVESMTPLQRDGQDVRAQFTVKAGDIAGMVLETGTSGPPPSLGHGEILHMYDETQAFWRRWLAQSTYRGRWRDAVERSAITLKLMTYAPSGGLVAAPTAGLPEQMGGERNWDYRFTWVRDGAFSVLALLGIGFTEEAAAFGDWLRERVEETKGNNGGPLRIMYRVDGSSDLGEETLDHFEGHMGSRPVRVGNAASDQLQLDIYGEAMNSIAALDNGAMGEWGVGHEGWMHIASMIDWLCDHWMDPDEGIWETRGGRRQFVYGKVMSWVAFDRAIRMATQRSRPADLARWTEQRDRAYQWVMSKGWSDTLQAFVQYEGSDVLDASLVMMPLVGIVVPNDRRWHSTLAAMDKTLVSDSLVYRYDPAASPDGLPGSEGTFSLCSFLYVDSLVRSGYLEEARWVFSKMLTYGNHVGLYSEEIDPAGRQVGNFPQAFTHLALIAAAVNLDHHLDSPKSTLLQRLREGMQ
jgi:GH15 family glucan-1,4-alpha-glucosidase